GSLGDGRRSTTEAVITATRRKRRVNEKHRTTLGLGRLVVAVALAAGVASSHAAGEAAASRAPLVIEQQGSFAVGGTVIRSPGSFDATQPTSGGQTLHGDHARVFYQVPANARPLPLVMWHGF